MTRWMVDHGWKESCCTEFKNKLLDTRFDKVDPANGDKGNFITRWMVEHGWKIKAQYSEVHPLNADDDNFITHWVVEHGWKIKTQYSEVDPRNADDDNYNGFGMIPCSCPKFKRCRV